MYTSSDTSALLLAIPRGQGPGFLGGHLVRGLRRSWLHRVLLVMVLMLGAFLTASDRCQVCQGPSEPNGQVLCLEECECLPAMPKIQVSSSDLPDEIQPNWPPVQTPRERARKPEHAPPRRG